MSAPSLTVGFSTSRKSGGKPAFPTLRLLNLLDGFTLKAIHRWDHNLNSNQLGVRKVGLPPLFLPFCAKLTEIYSIASFSRSSASLQYFFIFAPAFASFSLPCWATT